MPTYNNKSNSPKRIRQQALAQEIILVSPPALEALRDKIPQIRSRHKDLLRALGATIEDYPDLRENATYDVIKNKIDIDVPADLYGVREKLLKAVPYSESLKDAIGFGDKFTAASDAGESQYYLLGPIEASESFSVDGVGAVSYLSPLGRAVWGAKSGSTCEVKLPAGKLQFTFTKTGRLDTA